MLFMESSLISRYHPSWGDGRGVKKTYPCLGGNILMESHRDPCLKYIFYLGKEIGSGNTNLNPKFLFR
jgi:hypothetical protein